MNLNIIIAVSSDFITKQAQRYIDQNVSFGLLDQEDWISVKEHTVKLE